MGLVLVGATVALLLGSQESGGDDLWKFQWFCIRMVLLLICSILGASGCVFLIMDRKKLKLRVLGLGIALFATPALVVFAYAAYHLRHFKT
jgi:hypothetical protein